MAGRPPISVAVSPSLYPVRESIGASDRIAHGPHEAPGCEGLHAAPPWVPIAGFNS